MRLFLTAWNKRLPTLDSQLRAAGAAMDGPPATVGQLKGALQIMSAQYGIPLRKQGSWTHADRPRPLWG